MQGMNRSMPDYPQFSRLTIIAAANVLTGLGHSRFDNLMLQLDVSAPGHDLQTKATNLASFALDNPDRQTDDGRNLSDAIVYEAASLMGHRVSEPEYLLEDQKALLHNLERDGFGFTEDGELRRILPEVLDLPATDNEVHQLLDHFGFNTPRGHLDQAIAAHSRGEWAGANSQMRSFMEGLFDEIANIVDPANAGSAATGHARRQLLARAGFLSESLNEWSDQGTGFINGFFRRLHPHGSHPGLSDEEDATFRLHLVLLVARQMLRRLS